MMRPGIILLREGTDTSQGKAQLVSNINACHAVAEAIRTTLGPSGRDKLVFDGSKVTISNDGATIMKLLEIEHPAARTLGDISISQDAEVGDGTTSVVLLAAEILQQVKPLVEEGVPAQIIRRHLQEAGNMAVNKIRELAVPYLDDPAQLQEMLLKCASTALNSKLIATNKDLFAPMVVRAVELVAEGEGGANKIDEVEQLVAIKQIPGGDVRQSFWVQGVAFKKTFSYAGFEQMTKRFETPKVLLLNVELELKSEKENAEVRISDPSEYQSIVDAEWKVIFDKLDACVNCGANIVLSRLPIGDVATQYFADRGLFCAGRVTDADISRVSKATGATVQTTTHGLASTVLGTCGLFEERQVGDQRFNVFTECPKSLTSTIVLRGGTEQFIAESERSVHDALMVVRRAIQSGSVVAGGGAVEMVLSKHLKDHALQIQGKGQMVFQAFAKALEVIPRQLCLNAGFDATDIMSALRSQHSSVTTTTNWTGVDVTTGSVCNTFEAGVWEPSDNKSNSLSAATEAACLILSIDETVVAPRSQDPGAAATGMMDQQGKPMSSMMGNAMQASQGMNRTGQLGPGVSYMKGRGGG